MEHFELLRYTTRALEDLGIPYFVTGSTATIFYGEPRFTNDIDIVADLSESLVSEFCRKFPIEDFYVSESAGLDAVRRKGQFNIIHPASGLKVDVIVPAQSAFNRSRFARVNRVNAGEDYSACFSSAEDAIIKKMDYFRQGGSEKHLRDITGVLKTSRDRIDSAYISAWADRLGLEEIWKMIMSRIDRV